jgi:hypothetical protein
MKIAPKINPGVSAIASVIIVSFILYIEFILALNELKNKPCGKLGLQSLNIYLIMLLVPQTQSLYQSSR